MAIQKWSFHILQKALHFCFCIEAMNCWSQPWVCLVSYGKDKGNFWPIHGRLYNYNLKYSHDLILCLNLVILQTVYYTLCVSAFLKRFDKIFFNLFQECLWTCCEMGRCPIYWKRWRWAQCEWSYVNNLVKIGLKSGLAFPLWSIKLRKVETRMRRFRLAPGRGDDNDVGPYSKHSREWRMLSDVALYWRLTMNVKIVRNVMSVSIAVCWGT